MKYARSILNGYSGPIRKMLAKQLGIGSKHKHKAIRRRLSMKSMKPGGGGRFAAFKRRLEGKGYSAEASGAIAADAGRKKYGNKKMGKMAAMGRRRAQKASGEE